MKWRVAYEKEIEKKFSIKKVTFINDFAAMGYGVLTCKDNVLLALNGVKPDKKAAKALIGPGTGLGEAFLFKSP